MKRTTTVLFGFCLLSTTLVVVDTRKLTNGQVIYGVFIGRANDVVQFMGTDGTTKSYPTAQVGSPEFLTMNDQKAG